MRLMKLIVIVMCLVKLYIENIVAIRKSLPNVSYFID